MSSSAPDDEDVYETAAAWWQRLRSDESCDIDALETWLLADPKHADAFESVKMAWGSFDVHHTEPEVLALRGDVLSRVRQMSSQRWGGKPMDRRTLVAGAALVAAAVVAVPISVDWFLKRPKIVSTGIGEQRSFTLADGSRVTLDANSVLKVTFSRNFRLLDLLNGRAHFEVAKDAMRPFMVRAGDRTVTAIGTAFSVEWREKEMSVILFEGRIALGDTKEVDKAPQPIVQPFEIVTMREGEAQPLRHEKIDPDRALGWREGKLFFDDEPLNEAAARMNDYSSVKIVVSGSAAKLRINGMFLAGQTGAFVEALESYYPITANYGDDTVTIKTRS